MKKSLYDYCIEQERTELIDQWHPTANEELTPHQISYASKKKVWWCCARGHEWQARVCDRRVGNKCPYCSNKRVVPGENDLLSQNPKLVESWCFEKNKDITPEQISGGSSRNVWWKCEYGHEWRAAIKTRNRGAGCPVCARRQVLPGENDLATTHPDLAEQWHPTDNGDITPQSVVAGTARKVWWLCKRGHVWKAAVNSRVTLGTGCPICAGKIVVPGENDLSSLYPYIAAEWHPQKNEPMTPQQVTPFSNRKAWWVCPLGHEYYSVISGRTERSYGCPYCSGRNVLQGFNDLATVEPEVAKQWHPELNGTLTPEQVVTGSHKKVWWKCSNDHVWKAVIHSRARGNKVGCPVCAGKVKESRQQCYADMMENK